MKHASEQERLNAVNSFLQLNFDHNTEFQDIVNLAAELCDKPVALITLLGEDHSWVKVRKGVDIEMIPREMSFCKFSILQDDLLIVHDTAADERFAGNPFVCGQPGVRFYAGAPLVAHSGLKLGTLCLFDTRPNTLSPWQQKLMAVLSRQVTFLMELELSRLLLQQRVEVVEAQNRSLRRIAEIQSHEVRRPLSYIMGLVEIMQDDSFIPDREWLGMMEQSANDLDGKIRNIVELACTANEAAMALA